ncbi:MAG: N-acetylmuramoyl-L-alanine amidase [Peptostreptococcaceae bacterium]
MKLLILDSGHNEYVSGKEAPDKSLREWEFNKDIQSRLKKRAEEHGLSVFLTNPSPDKKDEIGLTKRAQLANDYWSSRGKSESLFVSLHANAFGTGFNDARGTETYVAENASSNSKKAAELVQSSIYKMIKSIDSSAKDRGVKTYNFTVIYKAIMPAILIEYAFYTNRADLTLLKNNRAQLVEATMEGICKYFNISYKPVNSDNRKYENCIVYSGEVDKTIAQVLSWSLKNHIIVDSKSYNPSLAKQVFVVGSAASTIDGSIKFTGKDRWETLNLVLEYTKTIN